MKIACENTGFFIFIPSHRIFINQVRPSNQHGQKQYGQCKNDKHHNISERFFFHFEFRSSFFHKVVLTKIDIDLLLSGGVPVRGVFFRVNGRESRARRPGRRTAGQ